MYSFGKPSTDANKTSTQTTPQSSYFPFTASTQSTQPMSFFNQVQQTAQQSQPPQQSQQPQQSQPQQSHQITATSLFSQPTPSTQTQQPASIASSWFSQPTQQSQTQQQSSSFFSQPPQQPLSTTPSSQTQSSFFPPPTTTSFFPQAPAPSSAPASTDVNQLLTKIVDMQSQTLKLQEQMQTTLSSLTNQSKVVFNRTCDGCNSIAIIGEIHTALNHCVYDLCSDCYKTKKPPGAIFVTVTTTEALEYLLTMQKIIPTKSL
jgi:hypothetical protein